MKFFGHFKKWFFSELKNFMGFMMIQKLDEKPLADILQMST